MDHISDVFTIQFLVSLWTLNVEVAWLDTFPKHTKHRVRGSFTFIPFQYVSTDSTISKEKQTIITFQYIFRRYSDGYIDILATELLHKSNCVCELFPQLIDNI